MRRIPFLLDRVGEAALQDRVAGQLAHVARGELPELRGDTVLLDEGLPRVVELQRVVRRQRDVLALRCGGGNKGVEGRACARKAIFNT